MHIKQVVTKDAQRGGALLVAMVMIFMLSIMGVSAMRGSTLEHRMATNSIQTSTALQAAESATEMALNNDSNLSAVTLSGTANGGGVNEILVTTDLKLNSNVVPETYLRYLGNGVGLGASLSQGGGGLTTLRFESESEVEIESAGTRAMVVQGAYLTVPSTN